MTPEALKHLTKSDAALGRLIRRVGECKIDLDPRRTPFQSLVSAVAHQQLNGTAAGTILRRFRALFPGKRFPAAGDLAKVTDEALRAAGFSRGKIASIRDIAAKTESGVVPTSRKIIRLTNEEIIERLIAIRGVGQWTVEMLLIFKLGRPDVLPATDFGIRSGFALTYGHDELPPPKKILEHGERWRPYRTTASWYLWRAVDLAKQDGGGK
ncbi:MAG: DNA-3-methyladenine glycosylase 2 family protein [Verrucomicrobia bacterium]|nr:DNA-3-methyladenine glycosylase 2 family protein [Verrucomicrobiota bacterium]